MKSVMDLVMEQISTCPTMSGREEPPPAICQCGCGELLQSVHFWTPEGGVWRYPTICSRQDQEYKRRKKAASLRESIEWIDEIFPRRCMGPRQLEATLDNYEPFEGILVGLMAARTYLENWEENEKRGCGLTPLPGAGS